jgi:hypothetical protein
MCRGVDWFWKFDSRLTFIWYTELLPFKIGKFAVFYGFNLRLPENRALWAGPVPDTPGTVARHGPPSKISRLDRHAQGPPTTPSGWAQARPIT